VWHCCWGDSGVILRVLYGSVRRWCCSNWLGQLTKALHIAAERVLTKSNAPPAQVVPEQRLTLQQLAQFDGSDAAKPIMLAIRGTVFDVTKGGCRLTSWFMLHILLPRGHENRLLSAHSDVTDDAHDAPCPQAGLQVGRFLASRRVQQSSKVIDTAEAWQR
jgi:predicted heme/steroid binding protein